MPSEEARNINQFFNQPAQDGSGVNAITAAVANATRSQAPKSKIQWQALLSIATTGLDNCKQMNVEMLESEESSIGLVATLHRFDDDGPRQMWKIYIKDGVPIVEEAFVDPPRPASTTSVSSRHWKTVYASTMAEADRVDSVLKAAKIEEDGEWEVDKEDDDDRCDWCKENNVPSREGRNDCRHTGM